MAPSSPVASTAYRPVAAAHGRFSGRRRSSERVGGAEPPRRVRRAPADRLFERSESAAKSRRSTRSADVFQRSSMNGSGSKNPRPLVVGRDHRHFRRGGPVAVEHRAGLVEAGEIAGHVHLVAAVAVRHVGPRGRQIVTLGIAVTVAGRRRRGQLGRCEARRLDRTAVRADATTPDAIAAGSGSGRSRTVASACSSSRTGGECGHLGFDAGLLHGRRPAGIGLSVGHQLLGLGLGLAQRRARLLLGRRHQRSGPRRCASATARSAVRWASSSVRFIGLARIRVLAARSALGAWPSRPCPALRRRRLGLHGLDAPGQLSQEAADLLGVVPLPHGAELHAGDGLRAEFHRAIV